MRILTATIAILALFTIEARSNEVEVPGDRAIPSVEHFLQVVQLKLDQLFIEANEKVEQLLTELYHLRQSVDHVTWVTNRIEQAVQKVQLDNDVLVRNVTQLTSQTDNIILNQQYCANHEALKNLFFEMTPKCLENPTLPPPMIPSTTLTTEAVTTETTTELPQTTTEIFETTTELSETTSESSVYDRCSDAPSESGVYLLRRSDGFVFRGFCEQERFGGGLLVFQSRLDGSVDFNRSWVEFERGFGDPTGEHWLGLETLDQVAPNAMELVIAMKNFSNIEAYEIYDSFWINSASENYRIWITSPGTGTAGDSLYNYSRETFMTYDRVTSVEHAGCLADIGSAFWHYSCSMQSDRNNLNGVYGLGKGRQGIWWGTFGNLANTQNTSPLKTVQMMIRF